MKKTNLYMDLHVLQTVPPSCVNRDDTGSPKTAVYGGATRARISSQAWKHAIRMTFGNLFDDEKVGMRTKHIPAELAKEIIALDPTLEDKALALALDALNKAGIGTKQEKKDPEAVTKALFFASRAQLKRLAELAVCHEEDKKKYQEALKSEPAIDIALFGRMVADDPSLNFDAAAQVAHAISTHAVHNEYDYFTAVDDCNPEDTSGAGHLGTVEFNSSTLYRYATVNINELAKLLGNDDAVEAAIGFAEAFIYSMPDGKQNTFANRTLPDMVYITLRRDMPINLCGAFEKPVPASKNGYASASEEALIHYANQQYSTFADKPEAALGMGVSQELTSIADVLPHSELMARLSEKISSVLAGENI